MGGVKHSPLEQVETKYYVKDMETVLEKIRKWVKLKGKWVEAIECTQEFVCEPYYKVDDNFYSTRDLDEIGEQITETE